MKKRKFTIIGGLAALATGVALILTSAVAMATPPVSDHHKVTICHATGSQTNPYVQETVDIASTGYLQAGHDDHAGDIIPPYTYGDPVFNYGGHNWTQAGQAIWNNDCNLVTPSPSPSASPSPSPSVSPSASPSPSPSASPTPTPTNTSGTNPTPTPSATTTPTTTPTPTPTGGVEGLTLAATGSGGPSVPMNLVFGVLLMVAGSFVAIRALRPEGKRS